jgi:hypothetical protein
MYADESKNVEGIISCYSACTAELTLDQGS